MNNLINVANKIPITNATQTISINSYVIPVANRGVPLEIRITAPLHGSKLPIVLLSHGHGPSLYIPSKDGYGPLANFYAEHGFVVIQPNHVNSKVAGLHPDMPGGPLFWRSRVNDMSIIIDNLPMISDAFSFLSGRLDFDNVAVVGHSLGGQTVGMLLGAQLTDPKDDQAVEVNLFEPRIKAGILIGAPGLGGEALTEFASENYSCLNPNFKHLTTKSLVVVGDEDKATHLTTRGSDWYLDPYHESPGADSLLTIIGGRHGFGGIAGFDAKETTDEDPERLAIVQRMTWSYLQSTFYETDQAWHVASQALDKHAREHAYLDCK